MPNDKPCLDCGQERKTGEGGRGVCKSCYYKRRRRGSLGELSKTQHSYEEYFALIVPVGNGCWPWPGFVNAGGYGMHSAHGLAHVRAYKDRFGPIPSGYDIGHSCHDNDLNCQNWRTCMHRRCVNPDHLVAQTRSENLNARPFVQSHCKRGHELISENVYVIPSTGSRQCKLCVRIVIAERKARQLAEQHVRTVVSGQRTVADSPEQMQLPEPARRHEQEPPRAQPERRVRSEDLQTHSASGSEGQAD